MQKLNSFLNKLINKYTTISFVVLLCSLILPWAIINFSHQGSEAFSFKIYLIFYLYISVVLLFLLSLAFGYYAPNSTLAKLCYYLLLILQIVCGVFLMYLFY